MAAADRIGTAIVGGVDLMDGAHDLRRTPGLIDAQIGHNVRRLEAPVVTGERAGTRPDECA